MARGSLKQVIKASSSIQISNTPSLIQRKAWNIMLAFAFRDGDTDTHTVSFTKLCAEMDFQRNRLPELKEAIEGLQKSAVEFNVLQKDNKNKWARIPLLGAVFVDEEEDTVRYEYPPSLRPLIFNPDMYAKLDIATMRRFNSKHSLALYELCIDYMDNKTGIGETPFIPLGEFKKIVSGDQEAYPQFKDANKRLIKAPISEIHEKTNVVVSAELQKRSKKVTGVKIRSRRRDDEKQTVAVKIDTSQEDRLDQIFRRLSRDEQDAVLQKAIDALSTYDKQRLAIMGGWKGDPAALPDTLWHAIKRRRDEEVARLTVPG